MALHTYVCPKICRFLVLPAKGTIIDNGLVKTEGFFELSKKRHLAHLPHRILNHYNEMRVLLPGGLHNLGHLHEDVIMLNCFRCLFILSGFERTVTSTGHVGVREAGGRGPDEVGNEAELGKVRRRNLHHGHYVRGVRTVPVGIDAADDPTPLGELLAHQTAATE